MAAEKIEPLFTVPGSSGDNHRKALIELTDNAIAGSRIYGCISHFDQTGDNLKLAEKFIDAANRGTKVFLIVRRGQEILEYFDQVTQGGAVPNAKIFKTDGCYGAKIHVKLFMFSASKRGGQSIKNVVLTGSGTLTSAGTKRHQASLIVSDEKLFNGLESHWKKMRDNRHNSSDVLLPSPEFIYSTNKVITAYKFPSDTDWVKGFIDNLHPTPHPTTGARPCLRIAMGFWGGDKRKPVMTAIRKKLEVGCRVEIVCRLGLYNGSRVTSAEVENALKTLRNSYPDTMQLWFGLADNPPRDVHSKYLMIEGAYSQNENVWEQNVWAGSENLTNAALRGNDELMLKVKQQPGVYKAFLKNFKMLTTKCDEYVP